MLSLLLLLFSIPNIICYGDSQTIPLRYETAINRLKQYQQTNFVELLDHALTYDIANDQLFSYSSSVSDDQQTQCEREFITAIQALLQREMWALKVFDAWGKPLPSGILNGNLYWVGSYDECLRPLYIPGNKTFVSQPFETQYCTVSPTSAGTQPFGTTGIILGVCIPSSCDHQDVVSLIHSVLKNSTISEDRLACSNDPPNGQKGFTSGAIVTIILLSLLGFLVFLGTIVDLILIFRRKTGGHIMTNINGRNRIDYTIKTELTSLNSTQDSHQAAESLLDTTPRKVFLAEFSALKCLRRIFTMKQKSDHETYPFLNGIRVLSLFWVIIGHSFLFGIVYTSNVLDVLTWTRNIGMQFIYSAEFSVDTFFLLSGFLTTILFVRQVEKDGKLSPRLMVLYYLHRYIRLTPTFLFVVAININLTPYFGNGPIYPSQQGFEAPLCRSKYWWTSIVYLGNLVKSDNMCVPVSWYLHNDMQFHWLAPLCLIPFVMGRKPLGFIITILFTLVGIASIAGLLIHYPDLQTSSLLATPGPDGRTFFNTIYVKPWCRISPYFIGVIVGFFVLNTGRSYSTKRKILIVGNIVAILFVLICLFGMYPDSILVPGIDRTSFIFYQSFSRTLWSLAIGWLFFLCMTNQGGIVNTILSWPIWAPFARLNYGTYLTHLTIIYITVVNQRMPFYFQPHLVVNNFVVHIFFSYVAAILVVIFIETPFVVFEKKFFKR